MQKLEKVEKNCEKKPKKFSCGTCEKPVTDRKQLHIKLQNVAEKYTQKTKNQKAKCGKAVQKNQKQTNMQNGNAIYNRENKHTVKCGTARKRTQRKQKTRVQNAPKRH